MSPTASPADSTITSTTDEDQNGMEWLVSFTAAMIPISSFGYAHSRGLTGYMVSYRLTLPPLSIDSQVNAVVKSPLGVYGLLALPFVTLGMEKCIYDTTQAAQGINPNFRPADRGGFPSGGAALPSFSLLPVRKIIQFPAASSIRRRTTNEG
eukprot:CAMPEP_0168797732 /NCGR_PEP_ID=MMETSP0725-20121227/17501_1 /TAXON_ID=265536 /ORGANISM="Amphiprora sp., Strain CCMP467" /LENGTH=151 /DNA_ID=CAMNT_0008849045 /DNA_START=110 /DNA_END=566 /DNA_ORIENTATION=+